MGNPKLTMRIPFFEMEAGPHCLLPIVRGAVYFPEFRFSHSIIASGHAAYRLAHIAAPDRLALLMSSQFQRAASFTPRT